MIIVNADTMTYNKFVHLRDPAKKSSNLKSFLPLIVKPKPLARQRLRHSTYSLNPPGPAQTSAK